MSRAALAALAALLAVACGPDELTSARPLLVVDPLSVEFGDHPVLARPTQEISLGNLGRAPLDLESVRLEGDDAFTLGEAPARLTGGTREKLAVTFVPRETRSYAAMLILESNDPSRPHVEVPLTGTGTTVAAVAVEPESVDFGRVGQGRAALRRVRFTSVGTADLEIRALSFAEGSSAAYGFVGSTRTPQVVRARASGEADAFVEITLRFAPTSAAAETGGTLLVETNDPARVHLAIPLTASVNLQPVAVPGADVRVLPGTPVGFDGSASYDPDGDDPIRFRWTLVQRPATSAATLAGADGATPSFVPDEPGAYLVELVVTDAAALESRAERVTVNAVASESLEVELVWSHPVADLDLHFLAEGGELYGESDCNGHQCAPDFGAPGDPAHSGDKLSGFGPERVVWQAPQDGRYAVRVRYVSPQGSSEIQVRATVRFVLHGVIAREVQRVLETPGEVWDVAVVEWPSGRVTP